MEDVEEGDDDDVVTCWRRMRRGMPRMTTAANL